MTWPSQKRRQCCVAIEQNGPRSDRDHLNMPQMSGIELISHVRSRYPSISIVVMSGDYQGKTAPASIIADGFYPKGEHPHSLLTTIASLIATNPARGSANESGARPQLDS